MFYRVPADLKVLTKVLHANNSEYRGPWHLQMEEKYALHTTNTGVSHSTINKTSSLVYGERILPCLLLLIAKRLLFQSRHIMQMLWVELCPLPKMSKSLPEVPVQMTLSGRRVFVDHK